MLNDYELVKSLLEGKINILIACFFYDMPTLPYYDETTLFFGSIQSLNGRVRGPFSSIQAEARLIHRVFQTPPRIARKLLKEDNSESTVTDSVYTILMELTIKVQNPAKTFLEFARFTVNTDQNSRIIAFTPKDVGIQANLKLYGERSFSISPKMELGVSAKASKNYPPNGDSVTNSLMGAGLDGGASLQLNFNNKKGWDIELPTFMQEIKGSRLDNNCVQWEVLGNPNAEMCAEPFGFTKVVVASMTVKQPKDVETKALVSLEGTVRRRKVAYFISYCGPVLLASPRKFSIP